MVTAVSSRPHLSPIPIPTPLPAVKFVWLELTGKCNPRCVHCYADSGPAGSHGSLTPEEWERVIGTLEVIPGKGGIFGDGLQWPPAGQVGAAVKANGGADVPGGPGPGFHFGIPGLAPGASFCNEQAHPNGFTTPPAPAIGSTGRP